MYAEHNDMILFVQVRILTKDFCLIGNFDEFPIKIRVSKAPLVLRSYHILLLQINLHINIWYRAGAPHPVDTLIFGKQKTERKAANAAPTAYARAQRAAWKIERKQEQVTTWKQLL